MTGCFDKEFINLDGLAGNPVQYIKLGIYSFELEFDPKETGVQFISTQNTTKLFENGELIGEWTEKKGWSTPAFHKLFLGNVEGYEVVGADKLILRFSGGLELHIEDEEYSALHIRYADDTSFHSD